MMALLLMVASHTYTFTILGEGSMSCGEWTDRRRSEAGHVLPESAWVLGYVTAMARIESARTGRKIANGIEVRGVEHWMDNYCASHPLDNIASASEALVSEINARSFK